MVTLDDTKLPEEEREDSKPLLFKQGSEKSVVPRKLTNYIDALGGVSGP